mmetsp:Transcript_8498/g.20893  ORF Transcript_8498/g.20893 Transcript_8498/m.20893 type:complete len:826 (-) Transcript_8498:119-2596(-)|eukprot:CAMPEP_0116087280 /NCGR_PEP_ID=MMETSP0327-20121206/5283_1 /TAXON_ID=44447 /ORGANISM="Pseudo-nitzschia delicatissima, Strain B596" /LENGTH=825 /DNA_ID=CAMNT_0003578345 /DNA_START=168 /DNA_END=2645 /DNA_ORIENTATION=-
MNTIGSEYVDGGSFHDDGIVALAGGFDNRDSSFNITIEGMTLTAKPHAFAGAVLSPKHARELTPSLCLAIASGLADQTYRKKAVPYTLWITEAWRVLGWGEPSAALFWEMATMYHTLYLAGRAYATDFHETSNIPPILSCGSTSSMGSGNTHYTMGGASSATFDKKKFSSSTSASAKELPVWLVATFLLMHCEEMAYQRNLSALDDRRMNPNMLSDPLLNLLKYPGLSPRAHLNAGWHNDNSHCTAYLLRHLRKLLLLAAVSHNPDAVRAIMHLAAIPSPPPGPVAEKFRKNHLMGSGSTRYSAEDIRKQHNDEHGNVGLGVRLSMEDLERLHFWLQPPSGGGVDDSPLKIGDYLWSSLYTSPPPPTATIPIGDVEQEVRRHLELELLMAGVEIDDKEEVSTDDEETAVSSAFSQLSLIESNSGDDGERAKQPPLGNQKEINYTHLRGTTILLKPNSSPPSEVVPGTASITSGDHHDVRSHSGSNRLHDLAISDCSDVHMYLLQPFENVTIAACHDCTIVVGSVAGLVHVVDCDRTQITTASRRILLSNSCDTVMNVFTPTPPLLVGDNRSCQFAPYNTYYDGLREDLLATGLAAAAVPAETQSPFHGSTRRDNEGSDGPWPPLQCASNKWKYPIEISKLEIPQVAGSSNSPPSSVPSSTNNSPGADDKRAGPSNTSNAGTIGDQSVPAPILLPASEFHVLFVPFESESAKQRRLEAEANNKNEHNETTDDSRESPPSTESKYCRVLAEVLQFSPFRLPIEYERRCLVKADRMRNIQQAIRKSLPEDKQKQFEEELNHGFRDWLVTSGNLRQVLDLVHLERRGGI